MKFDIITIGSATRDAFFESPNFKLLKSSKFTVGKGLCLSLGEKIYVPKVTFTTGGIAINSAVTFSRLGFKTAAIARIGDDVSGQAIIDEMEKEGVQTDFLQIDKKLNTAYSAILLMGGERTILSYKGAAEHFNPNEIFWHPIRIRWIYLGSLAGKFNIFNKIRKLKNEGVRVSWNPGTYDLAQGIKKLKPYLDLIDVFILNEEEASKLSGIPYSNKKKIFAYFDKLIDGVLVITRGNKGVEVSDNRFLYSAGVVKDPPSPRLRRAGKKLVDRTGAGDAFGSAFVAALIDADKKKKDWHSPEIMKKAIIWGSNNAASVVSYVGAKEGILRKKEINKLNKIKINVIRLIK